MTTKITAPAKITPAKDVKPSNTLDQLSIRLQELADEAIVIQNVADEERRELSAEEVKKLDDLAAESEKVEREIKARMRTADIAARAAAMREPAGRQVMPDDLEIEPVRNGNGGRGPEAEAPRPYGTIRGGGHAAAGTFGFRSIGEWAICAHRHNNGQLDKRILNAPTTFGSEGQASDGGFALPPDFRATIMKMVTGEDSLLSRCDQQTTSSNSITLPQDNTTPWQTSGGVIADWGGEGGSLNQSKPQLGQLECKTNKLRVMVPLTDELLTDVPSMTSWLNSKVPDKFTSAINEAIVNGSGVGRPQGIMNSPAKVTQAAVSGQGANTVTYANVTAMWARMYARLRNDAVWLINQDVEPQLQALVVPGASPAYPAYLPPGGLSQSPYSQLFGRPIIPIEACQTLGTEGDIILTSLSQYLAVMKSEGMRTDVSIHLYFDTDTTAFRFIMRIGGQSYWNAPITRGHGSNTLSPIVTLNSSRT